MLLTCFSLKREILQYGTLLLRVWDASLLVMYLSYYLRSSHLYAHTVSLIIIRSFLHQNSKMPSNTATSRMWKLKIINLFLTGHFICSCNDLSNIKQFLPWFQWSYVCNLDASLQYYISQFPFYYIYTNCKTGDYNLYWKDIPFMRKEWRRRDNNLQARPGLLIFGNMSVFHVCSSTIETLL